MSEQNQEQQNKKKHYLGSIIAAVSGVVVGAGAIVGALVLKDEKNRKKIADTFHDVEGKAKGIINNIKDKMQVKQ